MAAEPEDELHQKPDSEASGLVTSYYDKPGVAKLKDKYILHDYKPTLDNEYISQSVKDQLDQASAESGGGDGYPPSKKMKLLGRNKKRPKGKREDPSDKICPYFLKEETCTFGERCKYSHDKEKFMVLKPKDIGDVCYLFETYGKCPYGLSCRYGGQHISEDNNNIVKDNHSEMKNRKGIVRNVLTKDTQVLLWKRKYDFSKADEVINEICPESNSYSRKMKGKNRGKFSGNSQSGQPADKDTASASRTTDSRSTDTCTSIDITKVDANISENVTKATAEHGVEPAMEKGNLKTVGKSTAMDNVDTNPTLNIDVTNKSNTGELTDSKMDIVVLPDNIISGETLQKESLAPTNGSANIVEKSDSFGAQKPGLLEDEGIIALRPQEKKKVDFSGKLYLAPLTTVGNLPFRRICKGFGADITCGEMAMCTNMLQGQSSEWALAKRHESEDIFGVQLCGAYPDSMTRCAQLINENMDVDFVDINCGCPIDLIFNKGEGSALMGKVSKFENIIKGMTSVLDVPLTVKMRTGIYTDKYIAHTLVPKLRDWGVSMVTVHGRTRVQRYTKTADWDYIQECAQLAAPMPLFGNGDVMSYRDANQRRELTGISGLMLARGALIKPWIFREIKEQYDWDISANERFDILKDFTNFGLDHWGSDQQGVESTRRFMLEWLSFLYRYIPVGLLERVPQRINEKPPYYQGRNDLETLMASPSCGDWVRISEMLLGPVPDGFTFLPKHKANAYK